MSFLQRLLMASSAGWTAALEAWRGESADTTDTRQTRYGVLWGFYLNDCYDELVNDYAQSYKANRALYTNIKALYNPVARLVDFYVAKIAGGTLDPAGVEGALPIEGAEPGVIEAIMQVWRWSHWGRKKALWARWGACLGDVVLKVVEDQRLKQVAIQVQWPGDLVDADFDRLGRVTYADFEYVAQERNQDNTLVDYTYREVITPESFATYKNGKPFDFVNNEEAGELWTWANEFGFVPVVVTRHKDAGHNWGLCAFHNGIPKIDDVNDLASHLGDQVRKAVHPQWIAFGAKPTTSGEGLERSDKIWYHPKPDGRIEALVEDINIADTAAEIQNRLKELERDFPELKVYQMSDSNLSGRAVKLLYGDVIDRVTEARGQYYAALVEANQMALRIGAYRALWAGSLIDEFEHQIGETAIFAEDDAEALALQSQQMALEQERMLLTGG